jgi:hypothetical protein
VPWPRRSRRPTMLQASADECARSVRYYLLSASYGHAKIVDSSEPLSRPLRIKTSSVGIACLHGYALCLWRLAKLPEAQQVFERILSLNPTDNQSVRFCWDDVRHRRIWVDAHVQEDAARQQHGP